MKWILIGFGVLILLVVLFLLIPVRYYFTFEKWKFFLHVDVLLGLWKKEIHVPSSKRKDANVPPSGSAGGEAEPADADTDVEDMAAILGEAEIRAEKSESPASGNPESEPGISEPALGKPPLVPAGTTFPPKGGTLTRRTSYTPSPKPQTSEPQNPESRTLEPLNLRTLNPEPRTFKPTHPSLFAQIRFAIENGLAGRVFYGAWKLLCHSFPGHWEVTGTFGTGDPMDTAMVQGLFCAFLPGVADGVNWNYIEKADALKGKGRGRIIPLYAAYIALTVLLSKEMREFWKYRKSSEK